MGKLIYCALGSLDGYVADQDGHFDWAAPDEEVHAFVNDLLRSVGTQLYGRRMYDFLVFWETVDTADQSAVIVDFANLWRATDKIVYSRTLERPGAERTRIEREFDPAAVRALKESSTRDLSIGGPEVAGLALRAGLVDELHLILNPVIVGGGTPALPADLRLGLELVDQRRFDNGAVHLHYRPK